MNEKEHTIIVVMDAGFRVGGAEKVLAQLIRGWCALGYKVVVVSDTAPESDFFKLPSCVERIQLLPFFNNTFRLFKALNLLLNTLKTRTITKRTKENNETILVSFLPIANIKTIISCIGLRVKVVVSERNDPRLQPIAFWISILRRLVYRYANYVVPNSERARKWLAKYVPEHKLIKIDNPVSLPREGGQPHENKNVLMVGRLVPAKNHIKMLRVFSEIVQRKELKEWSLVIVGDGPLRDSLKLEAMNLKIDKYVIFVGDVANVEDYYLNAGIYVLSSQYEGTPNTLMEAMGSGVPSLVSASVADGIKFIDDGRNALIYEGVNEKDLARKIIYLARNPSIRKKIGLESRHSMIEFSIENICREWCVLFKDTIK